MWRVLRLGYRHEPGLLLGSFALSQLGALPDALLALWLKVVGGIGVALGMYVFHVVMRTNPFAAPVVKIQAERKHQVVSTGPYAYVRHPMYGGAMFLLFGTPLLLGSWYAVAIGVVIALILALSGSFVQLAMLSIIARLATYIGTAAAVPVLRRKFPRTESTVRLPGGPTIPVAALVICLVFLMSATRWNLIAGAIALVVGLVLYASRRKPVAESAVPPAA